MLYTTNHPSYYMGKIECIDAIEAATDKLEGMEAFCTANAIKYLWRWKGKDGATDLAKAKWYIDRLISILDRKRPAGAVALMKEREGGKK